MPREPLDADQGVSRRGEVIEVAEDEDGAVGSAYYADCEIFWFAVNYVTSVRLSTGVLPESRMYLYIPDLGSIVASRGGLSAWSSHSSFVLEAVMGSGPVVGEEPVQSTTRSDETFVEVGTSGSAESTVMDQLPSDNETSVTLPVF